MISSDETEELNIYSCCRRLGGGGVGGLGVVWVGGGGEILGNVSKFVLSVEFVLKCPLKAISIYTAVCLC